MYHLSILKPRILYAFSKIRPEFYLRVDKYLSGGVSSVPSDKSLEECSGEDAVVAFIATPIMKSYLENIWPGVVIMLALSYAPQNISSACSYHAERMPASQPMQSMCMGMSAAATSATSTIILGTGVLASVFLFMVHRLVSSLLLVSLVVLISLILTGLTGLVSLESLVGHLVIRSGTCRTQGD